VGKRTAFHIDVKNRHPFCPALSYDEWERLVQKIGMKDAINLGFRVTERDLILNYGDKKSVPKHRKNPKGIDRP
jgi:hypothetical protein